MNNQQQLQPSKECFNIIKTWEGFSGVAYKFPGEGYYTIGYGHCSKNVKKGQHITLKQAEYLMHLDVITFAPKLYALNPALTQEQFDALCSLIYNIGWYNFKYSMTSKVVQQLGKTTQPIDVARKIVQWIMAGDKVLYGLQRRRVYEANYFLQQQRFEVRDFKIIEIVQETER